MMLRRGAAMAAMLTFAACLQPATPRDPVRESENVFALLAAGEIEAAAGAADAARRTFPQHGDTAVCSATIADLMWRDDLAIAEWRAVLASKDRAGWTVAMVRGRLGDQLFAAGRYGESIVPLFHGALGDDASRRRALMQVARRLPFRRKQIGPMMTEQPLLDGRLPEFECAIGDLRRPFAVDTGSSMTAISASLYAALGGSGGVDIGTVVDGTGQSVPAHIDVVDGFAAGDIWLGALPVLVVDDSRLEMKDRFGGPDRPPIGVLGLDVLSQFRMTLDPTRKSLVLEVSRGLSETSSAQCVRVDGRCLVPVAIEGRRLWFVLDTGASHSSLTLAGLQALPGGESRAVAGFRRVRSAGGGLISVREVHSLVLRVSQVRFPGVDLPVVDRGAAALFPIHGVLGDDLLRQCRVTFDRGRARLEPGP